MKFADPKNDIAFKKIFGDESKNELEVYEYIRKKEMDSNAALETAIEKGFNQGLERGLDEGKKVRNIEIAKTSLSQGLDIKTISIITGLSTKEIENIKI